MPPKPKVAGLAPTAATGDRLATLEELRDVLARALTASDVAARDVASLAGRLQAVLAEIAALAPPSEVKGTPLDELDKRRTARGAKPTRKPGAASAR